MIDQYFLPDAKPVEFRTRLWGYQVDGGTYLRECQVCWCWVGRQAEHVAWHESLKVAR